MDTILSYLRQLEANNNKPWFDAHIDLAEILRVFRSAKPFLDYVNRAIQYSREEDAVW